ncbi:MAG: alpha/beta hydrolase-fold protein [Saprospiraceae bacterium]|nr:alpha/beta hydrolase-fold protein [Saprospiraceae bacterium]
MKKLILLLVLVLAQLCMHAQSDDIIIGKIDSINSKILNEQRKLWVYVPQGSDESIFTKKTYPVVYLLDGDAHFFSTVGMIHQLSTVNGNTINPEMIVVGIPNTNRMRDLSPSKPSPGDDPMMPPAMLVNTGGGENFISFIETELIPYIESKYPTEPYKTFIGHSLGGLMVMHTFLNKPELFNAYVAIDPSMSWHKQKLLKEIKEAKFGEKYENKSLFMGFANTLPSGMDISMVENDTSPMSAHIRSIIALNNYFNEMEGPINYMGKYYANDDHGSVPFISGYDAIRFIFKSNRLKIGPEDIMTPGSDVANKIKNHYDQLSTFFGYEKKPAEDFLNKMGYQLMSMNLFDKSEELFKLNTTFYPDKFNVYDSLGDLYVAKGDKEKAIEYFKKALTLNSESTFTKEKLEKLEKR